MHMYDIEDRINRYLDQLESSTLTSMEAEAIKGKIRFLQELQEKE